MRRIAWVVAGVVAICLGVGAVWGVDFLLVEHGVLGTDPGPVTAPGTHAKAPSTPMSTANVIVNIMFVVIFLAIVIAGGYVLAKRRSARDAARVPGEEDDFAMLGPMRRRRMGDRTLDPIGGAPSRKSQPILAEPSDPRQLPADVARQADARRAGDPLDPRSF